MEEPLHTALQKYSDTLCTTQRQTTLSTYLLHDIPIFEGQATTVLEDKLSDIKTAADILKESPVHLAEGKLCNLTHTLICKALQAGKCWDDIMDIFHLKLCNVNIHTQTSHLMEIQQRDNKTLATYVHYLKTEGRRCDFKSDTTTICIFTNGLWDIHMIVAKIYDLMRGHQISGKAQCSTGGYSHPHTPTINVMSNDNRCFVYGKTGHIFHYCPDVQCCNC